MTAANSAAKTGPRARAEIAGERVERSGSGASVTVSRRPQDSNGLGSSGTIVLSTRGRLDVRPMDGLAESLAWIRSASVLQLVPSGSVDDAFHSRCGAEPIR
jgi:hypothetical protein